MKNLFTALLILFCSFAYSQQCEHGTDDPVQDDKPTEVFVYDMAGRFVAEDEFIYTDGLNVKRDLCLPNGIYIVYIPEKKEVFKIGLI